MHIPTHDEISEAYHQGPEAVIQFFKSTCESAMEELAGDPESVKLLNKLFDDMGDDGKIARKLWNNPETRLDAIDAIERLIDEKKRAVEELKAERDRLKAEIENKRIKAAMDSWRQGVRR